MGMEELQPFFLPSLHFFFTLANAAALSFIFSFNYKAQHSIENKHPQT